MITFAGILLLLSVPLALFGLVMMLVTENLMWHIVCGICALLMAASGQCIGNRLLHPTEKDVLKGRAQYVETQHITSGDTIRTYKLEWKK